MSYNDRGGNYQRNESRASSSSGNSNYTSSTYGGSDSGRRGGFRGGRGGGGNFRRDGYNRGGDDFSDQMGRMNMGGGMYSQQGGGRGGRVPRNNQYDSRQNLAGSAQAPNAPIPKKNLAHRNQKFAERPDGWVFDKKAVGSKTELLTNHALVHLPKETIKLYCYNIEIFSNKKLVNKREEAAPLFYEIIRKNKRDFPNSSNYIFNDVNMLWTSSPLPRSDGRIQDRRVCLQYKFTSRVDFGQEIREDQDRQLLATLVDAIATSRVRNPQCNKYVVYKRCMFMIQDVEEDQKVVMDSPLTVPLCHGLDARAGISIGIRLNLRAGITACYDISHTMFTRTGYPIIRLICELINCGPISDDDFEHNWDHQLQNAKITDSNRKEIDRILKKMKLRYSQDTAIVIEKDGTETIPSLGKYTQKGKEFKYYQLTSGTAANTMFQDNEGRKWSIAEWFLKCCNIRLRYPNLPCFVKKPSKQNPNFIAWPMEFVSYIYEPKRFEGVIPERNKSDLIQYTSYTAPQRRALLQHVMGQKGIADVPPAVDNNDMMMKKHGLSIEKEMLSVKATVLPPPTVVYGEGSKFKDVDHIGEWEAVTHEPIRRVLEGSVYVREMDKDAPKKTKRLLGSILNINSPFNGKTQMHYDPACYHHLMKALEDCGQPVAWENREERQAAIQGVHNFCQGVDDPANIHNFFTMLKNNIDEKYKKCDEEVLIPFVLVVFEVKCSTLRNAYEFDNDYNFIKYLADNEMGIYTQGILCENLSVINENPICCKLTRLMVEKILGKVGTTHRKLEREGDHKSWTKFTDPKSPVLVLGVDVCHPSPRDRLENDIRKLSVASVVGNIDFDCTEFRSSSRIQDAGEELIVRFRDEIAARLNAFIKNNNGVRPAHIVMYRDGLCENDFQRILYEERIAIEQCCVDIDPAFQPTITYIVVTKRHHTRFFLKDDSEGHVQHGLNVLPGTLVEDTVTTKDYYDFFLTTQVGQKGVARPTHYYVLHDTWKPFVSFWPTVTHALTYMFCRATSTVALPAPVLYAHLAAKRAKECLDGAWNIARLRNQTLSVDNVHDVNALTKAINVNNGLDGMTFV